MSILYWASVALCAAATVALIARRGHPAALNSAVLVGDLGMIAVSIASDWSPWVTALFSLFAAWQVVLVLGALGVLGEKWKERA